MGDTAGVRLNAVLARRKLSLGELKALAPGQMLTQVIRMPEGTSYFSIARTITRAGGVHGSPAQRLAIGLGCDVAYAPRLVYADGIDLGRTRPVDIGLNCYLCERPDCAARAHAPLNRRLKVNERERSLAIFNFETP